MNGLRSPTPIERMLLLDLTLPDPAANLALDEALLLTAEEGQGGEVLRLWESATLAAIVGAGGSVERDVNRTACEAEGVSILRRASGGGTVLLGPGCLGYSLVLRTDRAPGLDLIQPSTRYVLNKVLNAIRSVVPEATIQGTSDLAVNGFKFSGNAQQRKRKFFLHHGTLLCGFDLACLSRLLHPPERQPEYRRDRPHVEFVRNLPATSQQLQELLIAEWQPEGAHDSPPLERVRMLVEEKYRLDEWNRRR